MHTRFQERALVLFLADLADFSRAIARLEPIEVAELVDRFYRVAGEIVARHGGRVVKFSGDSCLAAFDVERATDAIACAMSLREAVSTLGRDSELQLDAGANIHLSTVITGRFGEPAAPVDDVLGAGVNHVFRMGSGPGIRVSEPVYRKLPSDERAPWTKRQAPATYTFTD